MAPRQTPPSSSAFGVACLACRERHSRCDATQPQCARCARNGRECVYIASRRGCRGPGRPAASEWSSPSTNSPGTNVTIPTPPTSISSENLPSTGPNVVSSNESSLVALYYRYFHRAHPFLLPQYFSSLRPWPPLLHKVVSLIGSQFCSPRIDFDFGYFVDTHVEACTDKTLEMVQTRLLSAILLHGLVRPDAAVVQLDKAVQLAFEIGLDHEWFAVDQGGVHPLLAESARRTWWELFIIDGYFAGFHHKFSFRAIEVVADTFLPCDEQAYENGFPPKPTLGYHHLRCRALLDDLPFSSFALRIEAIGILARALAMNNPARSFDTDSLQALDGLLSTWVSTLPDTKVIVSLDGRHDELLFQAQMIVLMANVYVHLPRSGIFSFISDTDVACAKANQQATPFLDLNMHATRSMHAAKSLAALASLDVGEYGHTLFFTCALVLVAIVHLSAMAAQFDRPPEWQIDRLSQVFGLLRSGSKAWPLASNAHTQLKKITIAASSLALASQPPTDALNARGHFEALMSYMWWFDGRCCEWQPPEITQGIHPFL